MSPEVWGPLYQKVSYPRSLPSVNPNLGGICVTGETNLIAISHQLTAALQLGEGIQESFPFLGWDSADLILCGSWAQRHSCCEFICTTSLLCHLVSSSTTTGPYNLPVPFSTMTPKPWEEGMWYRCPIWSWAPQGLLISTHWPFCLCISCLLLQKVVPLKRQGRCPLLRA